MRDGIVLGRSVAFLFPGQGAVPTLSPARLFPRHGVRQAYQALAGPRTPDFEDFHLDAVTRDHQAQAGSFAMGLALASALKNGGLAPDVVAGYSCGVYGVLVAAGMCTGETGLAIVDHAYDLIEADEPGADFCMTAVLGLDEARLTQVLTALPGEAWISLVNNPTQIIVSTRRNDQAAFRRACTRFGAMKVVALPFAKPYHTPRLRQAAQGLGTYLETLALKEPILPTVIGHRPSLASSADRVIQAVAEQLCQPVDWHLTVRKLLDSGVGAFICLDPSRALGHIVRWITRLTPVFDVGNDQDLDEIFSAFPCGAGFGPGLGVKADNMATV